MAPRPSYSSTSHRSYETVEVFSEMSYRVEDQGNIIVEELRLALELLDGAYFYKPAIAGNGRVAL
jgi:hypothetical protein